MATCGKCKAEGVSVAHVRECYAAEAQRTERAALAARATEARGARDAGYRLQHRASDAYGVTEKQAAFIASLRAERGLDVLPFTGSKAAASEEITRLLGLPKAAATTDADRWSLPDVPAGRYAVEGLAGFDNRTNFFRVDRPTEGRWAGRTFVKHVVAGREPAPVRNPAAARTILSAIAEDPKAALLRYGKEIGECGHCGRELTNDESRAVGIGPVCRAKMGW